MEAVTHLYTYPDAVADEEDRAKVDAALERLSTELKLPHTVSTKGGHVSRITIPDTTPEETWAAIERVVEDWPSLFMPRPSE